MELRCTHGSLAGTYDPETNSLETACKKTECGKRPGVVVLHRFDLSTGQVTTTRFRELTDFPHKKGTPQ